MADDLIQCFDCGNEYVVDAIRYDASGEPLCSVCYEKATLADHDVMYPAPRFGEP